MLQKDFDQSFEIRLYVSGFESLHDDDDEDDDNDEICFFRYLWVNFESLSPYSRHLRQTYRGIGKYAKSVICDGDDDDESTFRKNTKLCWIDGLVWMFEDMDFVIGDISIIDYFNRNYLSILIEYLTILIQVSWLFW